MHDWQILAAQAKVRLHRRSLVVHVQIQVRADQLETFRAATLANASASRREPGVLRFDVCSSRTTSASADEGVRWVRKLVSDLGLPALSHYGITSSRIPEIVARAGQASSMKANPLALTTGELAEVVVAATGPDSG